MPKLLHVVGARPNFMKVAPVLQAGRERGGLEQVLLHTGQHYDAAMSDRFFQELGLPEPDVNLGVGSGTHAVQTGKILIEFDPVLERLRPDWVVVYGDVNSTVACALAATKRGIRVAHVEAGLAQFRPDDAGGNQSDRHRSARRSLPDAEPGRQCQPQGRRAFPITG